VVCVGCSAQRIAGRLAAPTSTSPTLFPAHLIANLCSGLFTGAALYINLVEHPARMEVSIPAAVAEFAPSYRRAAIMQASLAIVGALAAFTAWWSGAGISSLGAAVTLLSVVPFTLVVIFPTSKQLLDPALDPSSAKAKHLLIRWGNLHAVRSVLGLVSFVLLVLSSPA
jgi:hypothetical protein